MFDRWDEKGAGSLGRADLRFVADDIFGEKPTNALIREDLFKIFYDDIHKDENGQVSKKKLISWCSALQDGEMTFEKEIEKEMDNLTPKVDL